MRCSQTKIKSQMKISFSSVLSLLRRRKEKKARPCNWTKLPESCIAHVLSLTSPRDACRASAVCSAFRSAAASDAVWERLLPSDYEEILSRAVEPVKGFTSKKELYFQLCNSILIDGGAMIFWLERCSGKKCYMIWARYIRIVWSDVMQYWRWISLPDSRFPEVAELLEVYWLDIQCSIDSTMLSTKTKYAVYLIFKLVPGAEGLDFPSQEALVSVGTHTSRHAVCLHNVKGDTTSDVLRTPRARVDGWMEIEMGDFFNDNGDGGNVNILLRQVKTMNLKRGLIIGGIEIRPKILNE